MKALYLTFEDERFEELKHAKEKYEKGKRINWEDFVYHCIVKKC